MDGPNKLPVSRRNSVNPLIPCRRAAPAGIAFYAADKLKKRAEKVNKHIKI
jgi:hypothetical protein